MPNLLELQAWRMKWNLADDRSGFTQALVSAAINETRLFGPLSATNIAWVTFTSLLTTWLPYAGEIPGFKPSPAESLQAALRPPPPQAFRFEFSRFNPFFETAATFKDAAKKEFQREIDAHITACRAALSTQDLTPVPVKRVPDIHFRWYIRFQVLGQLISQVATAECVEAGTVSLALDHVAELAGVPLRGSERGRPRKKQPPSTSGISS